MDNFFNQNEDLKFHLHHPLMKKIVDLKERNYTEKDTYPYAPVDYEDAMDNYDKVMEIVGDICANVLAVNAEDVDLQGPKVVNNRVQYADGTAENHRAFTEAGVVGMSYPRKYKGLNFPLVPFIMAGEMVAQADAGFHNIWGLQDCGETLLEFATDEINDEYIHRFHKGATAAMALTEPDAGSDLQAVQLKATLNPEDGMWYLNGVKRFITNGDADINLILARSEEGTNDGRGLSLFVYDKANLKVKVRRIENKLGIKGSPTCELVFNDAPAKLVGKRKFGLIKYVMSLMNGARLGIGAQSVGLAQAAYNEAIKYANERKQFGTEIVNFAAVYEMLSNMEAEIHANRTLLYETSRFVDVFKQYQFVSKERKLTPEEKAEMKFYTKLADVFTPLLKMSASEMCNRVASDSLQIHGGTGYMKDFPIERIYRDARITNIYEGTTQLQVIAAIKGVTTTTFIDRINEYNALDFSSSLQGLKENLEKLTADYLEASDYVKNFEDSEVLDFHARRLVEMAGNIIMSYLLLIDATKESRFERSARIFIAKINAINISHKTYIQSVSKQDILMFKIEKKNDE